MGIWESGRVGVDTIGVAIGIGIEQGEPRHAALGLFPVGRQLRRRAGAFAIGVGYRKTTQ